jgi:hypothetical protein
MSIPLLDGLFSIKQRNGHCCWAHNLLRLDWQLFLSFCVSLLPLQEDVILFVRSLSSVNVAAPVKVCFKHNRPMEAA